MPNITILSDAISRDTHYSYRSWQKVYVDHPKWVHHPHHSLKLQQNTQLLQTAWNKPHTFMSSN